MLDGSLGLHRDNGKENGNYFLGFRGLGFRAYEMVVSEERGNPNIDPKIRHSLFWDFPKWYPQFCTCRSRMLLGAEGS